ncbi:hypothetical protein JCM10212_007086 [Sporobolomyces blumeae]
MGRTATLHFVSLRNCLVNLPLSITGPLSQRGVAPQSIAVQLSFRAPPSSSSNGQTTVVAGWTGLPASVPSVSQHVRAGSHAHDRIEMDPQYAAMLNVGLVEGMQVSIELMRDLPVANTVNVTPLSADDWEILETNAEFFEMYLLNQVRAVKEGMVVGCWVNGSTLVRFVVDSTEPEAYSAVLLTSSTELIVAPKSRHAPPAAAQTKPHDLSTPSVASTHLPEWDATRKKLLRLLPLELEHSVLAGSVVDGPIDSATNDEAYLHPSLYRTLHRIFTGSKLALSHQARPKPRSPGTAGGGPEAEDSHDAGSAAAGATNKGKDDLVRPVVAEVRIRESSKVSVGHCWIGERVRAELGLKADSRPFELLRIGPPVSAASRKAARSRERKSSPSPHGSPRSNVPPQSLHQRLASTSLTNGLEARESVPPSVTSSPALAGVDVQVAALTKHVVNSLAARRLSSNGEAQPASGALVTGASGAGKSALVQEVSKRLEVDERALTHTVHVDCSRYADERQPTLKGRIKDWFDEACWHAPSLLVLDNLDRMIPAEVEHADSFASLHLANVFLGLAQSALASRPILIVATAQGTTTLHPLLTSTHLLGETVSLKGPTKAGRKDILNSLVRAKTASSNLTLDPKFNAAAIAAITEGYLPADLRDFVDRAVHQAAIRTMARSPGSSLTLTADDFNQAQVGFVPLSLRDVKLQKSETQWADIGGLHETRKTLRETLEWPTKYGAIFASCPLRLRSGLLLYGYPGCGKTLLASAVAKECGLNFISVKGPEILNKYIGASEKSVRDLFERAQAAKPCVLFFDEFDSIAPKRGHDSTGVTDRVVNQMLTQMDGAEGLDGVYVLAATSRPDLIDPALLRPGRLDKSLLCDMPSYEDRLEIMTACSRKLHLSPSISLADFAHQTEGYSGADLQALMYNAHLDAIHAGLTALEGDKGESGTTDKAEPDGGDVEFVELGGKVDADGTARSVRSKAEQAVVNKRLEQIIATMKAAQRSTSRKSKAHTTTSADRQLTIVEPHHLEKSLSSTRPSVPPEELYRLRRIYNDFVSTRSKGGLPSGEASDQVGGRASLM